MSPLSGVITESWALYKAHARHLISVAFVVFLPIAVVTLLVALVGGFFARTLADLVFLVGLYLLEAALVRAIQDVRDGTANLSVSQTFSAAMPSLGSVVGASILAGILIWIGFFFIIIPGIFLATIWVLIVPVIMVENVGALASFGRSRELVKGRFWNVLGTLILVFLIVFVAEIVLSLIFLFFPTALGSALAVLVAGSVIAPFGAAVVTLMYFRLVAAGPVMAGASAYGSMPGQYGAPPGGYPQGGQYGSGYQPGGYPQGGPPAAGFPQDGGFPPSTPPDPGFPPTS
jgi:hypothetical protein